MFETDKAVKNLVEYLKGIDEPTVLLFYGDQDVYKRQVLIREIKKLKIKL